MQEMLDDDSLSLGGEAVCLYDAERLAQMLGLLYTERLRSCQALTQALRCACCQCKRLHGATRDAP